MSSSVEEVAVLERASVLESSSVDERSVLLAESESTAPQAPVAAANRGQLTTFTKAPVKQRDSLATSVWAVEADAVSPFVVETSTMHPPQASTLPKKVVSQMQVS